MDSGQPNADGRAAQKHILLVRHESSGQDLSLDQDPLIFDTGLEKFGSYARGILNDCEEDLKTIIKLGSQNENCKNVMLRMMLIIGRVRGVASKANLLASLLPHPIETETKTIEDILERVNYSLSAMFGEAQGLVLKAINKEGLVLDVEDSMGQKIFRNLLSKSPLDPDTEQSYRTLTELERKLQRPEIGESKEAQLATFRRILELRNNISHNTSQESPARSGLRGSPMQDPETVLQFLRLMKGHLLPAIGTESTVNPDSMEILHSKSAFFEVRGTFRRLLDHFQQLFGLIFIEITGCDDLSPNKKGSDLAWHKDVRVFGVWNDLDENAKDHRFVGYLYCDLLSRDMKPAENPKNICLGSSYEDDVGNDDKGRTKRRSFPATVVVANYEKSSDDSNPTLLSHPETVQLFHETGHAIHHLTSFTKHYCDAAINVDPSFNETPSQFLEHFIWEPKVLQAICEHHETQKKIDAETLNSWIEARHVSVAEAHHVRLAISEFLVRVHDFGPDMKFINLDLAQLWQDSFKTEWTPPDISSAWGADASRYTSSFYTYIFGKVLSYDLFTRFEDPFDRAVGLEWRKMVLEPGATKVPMQMMADFLDRSPSVKPYFDEMGIDIKKDKIDEIDALFAIKKDMPAEHTDETR